MAVEPRGCVAVGPGGGRRVACREKSVLGVPLARAFPGGRPAEVLDAVQDEIGIGRPEDGAEGPTREPQQGRLAVLVYRL